MHCDGVLRIAFWHGWIMGLGRLNDCTDETTDDPRNGFDVLLTPDRYPLCSLLCALDYATMQKYKVKISKE